MVLEGQKKQTFPTSIEVSNEIKHFLRVADDAGFPPDETIALLQLEKPDLYHQMNVLQINAIDLWVTMRADKAALN